MQALANRVKRFDFTIAKNAAANVLRGGASGILALVLPPLLTRVMEHDRFAAWALILQFAAYVNFLDFGLQTAVSRYVARAIERGSVHERNRIISTAFAMLASAGALAYLVIACAANLLATLFHSVPPTLLSEMHSSILVLAAFYAISLPLSTFTGTLIGMQRSEFPALAIGGAKLLGGTTLILVVRHSQSLVLLALVLGGWQVCGGVVQYLITRKLLPGLKVSFSLFSRADARELIHYCAFLSVWLFGGFLINGLDLVLVSHFQFSATGYYSIATSLINFIATLNGAVFGAMLPATAVLHTRKEFHELGQIVLRTTRYSIYLLVLAALPVFLFGKGLLRLWIGRQYAASTLPLLIVLLAACVIRFSGNPYAVTMLGTGQHRHNTVGTLAEGFANVIASIFFARSFGAIGIAYGTLLGSVVGLACHIFYNVPRTHEIKMSVREYGFTGLLSPTTCLVPLLMVCFLPHFHAQGHLSTTSACFIAALLTVASVSLVIRLERWWTVIGMAARRPLAALRISLR